MFDDDVSNRHWLPWAGCNLRRNPFGELTSQERAHVAVVDVGAIARLASEPGTAVQLLGSCGRGKSTRMFALLEAIPDACYVYIPENRRCPPIPEGMPLLIDEAHRLSRRIRHRVFASQLPLVLGTHTDLRRPLKRHGYVVHNERIGLGNTPELVRDLLNRRIYASRLGEGAIPRVTLHDAQQLVRRFGSNIRGIENYLYERMQTQVIQHGVSHHGEVRFVD